MGKLDGRVAIITGGSGGIGRAAAKRFVDEGANVLLVDIEERALRDSINAIGEKHASWICADVTSDDDTQGYVRRRSNATAESTFFSPTRASKAISSRFRNIRLRFSIASSPSTFAACDSVSST